MTRRLSLPITPADHHRGRIDAPMQLTVYGDYECPYTRRALIQIRTVREKLADDLVVVFRNFPLVEVHPHAMHAARAAEAAAEQGKFWEMHDLLFDHQRALTDGDLAGYARQLGLDEARFERDRAAEAVLSRIESDVDSGESSGVKGTPTLFINGRLHRGSYEASDLIDALKRSFATP
ncbi:MAG TPA: thioredoxin domain-containing protein [Candidatus Dormibacteraeota bacterium]|nr:thioredoxin domain-containing protein [Candidatus Dormibacteraeota bacterium]